MAGRNRGSRHLLNDGSRGSRHGPRPVIIQGPGPLLPHPAALQEELEIQHEEMRRLLSENRHLVDDHQILRRELNATKDEIHRLSQIIPQLRADKETQARELIQKGLKLESELRGIEPLKAEVAQLRAEAQKLNDQRQELSTKLQGLTQDLTRMKAENKHIPMLRLDMDGMQQELIRAREAFEYEKKVNLEQIEQKQVMEKNINTMAREVEKLRAEIREKSALGLGGAYGVLKGSSELGYGGSAFGDSYGGAWGAYDRRGPPRL